MGRSGLLAGGMMVPDEVVAAMRRAVEALGDLDDAQMSFALQGLVATFIRTFSSDDAVKRTMIWRFCNTLLEECPTADRAWIVKRLRRAG